MAATVFDLVGPYVIEKGLPWEFKFTRYAGKSKTPLDLTGCQARLEFYDTQAPDAAPLVFSTASNHITLGGPAGTFLARLTALETADIAAVSGRYRLYFTDSLGKEYLHMRGRIGYLEAGQ